MKADGHTVIKYYTISVKNKKNVAIIIFLFLNVFIEFKNYSKMLRTVNRVLQKNSPSTTPVSLWDRLRG